MISIVAHRGYAAKYPENTIEACQAAVDAGARWVEVDVQMRSGVPVLSHDVPRVINGPEPRLREFAEWLEANPDVTAFVDLKSESLIEHGPHAVIDACLDLMRGNWHPISFDYGALALADARGAPDPGWVICEFGPAIHRKAEVLGARWLIMNQMFLPPGPIPSGPWEWMVYEVATPEQGRALIDRGVRWLETMDFPTIRDGIASCSQ